MLFVLNIQPIRAQGGAKPSGLIKYSVEVADDGVSTALRADSNGKTHELIGKSKKMCLQVYDQRDFDGNGLADALVSHSPGCGGNCCSDSYFFVSASSGDRFELSDEFADSRGFPVIEKWKGRWSVVVTSTNEGIMNQERPLEITRRFILEAGKAVRVEEHRRRDVESIVEIRSEIFNPDRLDETHSIEYDLDGDGKNDQITCKFWARWGSMLWSVEFANGKKFSSDVGCKRIGVLKTKTNGVSDLVCDQSTIFRWDGSGYRPPSTP
jgi:hypothetical protein